MSNWKEFANILIPEDLTEEGAFDYIKNEVLSKEEGKVFDFFIKEGLLRLEDDKE